MNSFHSKIYTVMIVFVRKTCFYSRHDGYYDGVGFGRWNCNVEIEWKFLVVGCSFMNWNRTKTRKSCAFNFSFHCCIIFHILLDSHFYIHHWLNWIKINFIKICVPWMLISSSLTNLLLRNSITCFAIN